MIITPTAINWDKPVDVKRNGKLCSCFEFSFVMNGTPAEAFLFVDRRQFDPAMESTRPVILHKRVNLWSNACTFTECEQLGKGTGLTRSISYLG